MKRNKKQREGKEWWRGKGNNRQKEETMRGEGTIKRVKTKWREERINREKEQWRGRRNKNRGKNNG